MIEVLGRAYLRWAARRRLDGVWLRGVERLAATLERGPVIFAANHVSWWDGPIGVLLHDALDIEGRFLVDAENLSRVPYLRRFGAIDLSRESALGPLGGLRAAAAFLEGPRRALWIYPQGRQRPAHARPLELKRGVELVARRCTAAVVPVAISYGWRESHRPAAALSFGPAVPGRLDAIEQGLLTELAALDAWFDRPDEPLTPLIAPRSLVQDGMGAKLLALGTRRER